MSAKLSPIASCRMRISCAPGSRTETTSSFKTSTPPWRWIRIALVSKERSLRGVLCRDTARYSLAWHVREGSGKLALEQAGNSEFPATDTVTCASPHEQLQTLGHPACRSCGCRDRSNGD